MVKTLYQVVSPVVAIYTVCLNMLTSCLSFSFSFS